MEGSRSTGRSPVIGWAPNITGYCVTVVQKIEKKHSEEGGSSEEHIMAAEEEEVDYKRIAELFPEMSLSTVLESEKNFVSVDTDGSGVCGLVCSGGIDTCACLHRQHCCEVF